MIEKRIKRDWHRVSKSVVYDFCVGVEEERAGWPEGEGLGSSDVNCLMLNCLHVHHEELDDIPNDVWWSWKRLFHRVWNDELGYIYPSSIKPDMLPGVEIDMAQK